MTTAREDVECPVPACTYRTGEHDAAVAAAMLMAHITVHNAPQAPVAPQRRPPKVDRPKLLDSLDEVGWNAFLQEWEPFLRTNDIDAGDQAIQLFTCCDSVLKSKITLICPDVHTKTVDELLTALKSLVVIPVWPQVCK